MFDNTFNLQDIFAKMTDKMDEARDDNPLNLRAESGDLGTFSCVACDKDVMDCLTDANAHYNSKKHHGKAWQFAKIRKNVAQIENCSIYLSSKPLDKHPKITNLLNFIIYLELGNLKSTEVIEYFSKFGDISCVTLGRAPLTASKGDSDDPPPLKLAFIQFCDR